MIIFTPDIFLDTCFVSTTVAKVKSVTPLEGGGVIKMGGGSVEPRGKQNKTKQQNTFSTAGNRTPARIGTGFHTTTVLPRSQLGVRQQKFIYMSVVIESRL
jgi:hypothetical protein